MVKNIRIPIEKDLILVGFLQWNISWEMSTEHGSFNRSKCFPINHNLFASDIKNYGIIIIIGYNKVVQISQFLLDLLNFFMELVDFVFLNVCLFQVDLVLPLLDTLVSY